MPGIIAESHSAVVRKPTKNEQRRARQKQQKQEKQQNGIGQKENQKDVSICALILARTYVNVQ
jgi:hypothetical protein